MDWFKNPRGTWAHLTRIFGLDLRSLAFFRVSLAVVVMGDLIDRWVNAYDHYSDNGVLPRELVLNHFWNNQYVSLHMTSGTPFFAHFMFLLNFMCAFFLFIGWKTQWMAFVCWYLNISLQMRSPIVLHNGDVYERMLLFWAIFLPLGKFWSVDEILKERSHSRLRTSTAVINSEDSKDHPSSSLKERSYLSLTGGMLGYLFQIYVVYTISYYHKLKDGRVAWFEEEYALYYALNMDYYRTFVGDFFLSLGHPILKIMTRLVLWWEWGGVFFLVLNKPWRVIGVAGFFALHLGFILCLRLGQFPAIGCVATLGFLPPWFWDSVIPWFRGKLRAVCGKQKKGSDGSSPLLTVYYNTSCAFTCALSRFVDVFLLLEKIRIVPLLADEAGDKIDPDEKEILPLWIVGQGESNRMQNFKGFVTLLKASPIFWPFGWLLSRPSILNLGESLFLYSVDTFGSATPLSKKREDIRSKIRGSKRRKTLSLIRKIVMNCLGAYFGIFVFLWCSSNLGHTSFPNSWRSLAAPLMLYQSWNMFSPPPQSGWYHVVIGTREDGTEIELMKDGALHRMEPNIPANEEPPVSQFVSYYNHRWYKFFESVNWNGAKDQVRLHLGYYICREFNRKYPKNRIHIFNLKLVEWKVNLDYTRGPRSSFVLWNHQCY